MLQKKAADRVKSARREAIARSDADIRKNTESARKDYQRSFDAAGPEALNSAIEQQQLARTADYQGAVADPQNIVSDNTSDAAKRAIAKALASGTAESRDRAGRKAAVEAYGGATFGRDIDMNRAETGIRQMADFTRGGQAVTALELEEANNAGKKYADLAGIVDAIGTVAGAGYGVGVDAGMWGGTSPTTGITWNTARAVPKKIPAGPFNPNTFGPFKPGQVGYYG